MINIIALILSDPYKLEPVKRKTKCKFVAISTNYNKLKIKLKNKIK
jgi:hypothetical protein